MKSTTPSLITTLSTSPHNFLPPAEHLTASALNLAKRYLDPLASSVYALHRTRQLQERQERKEPKIGRKRKRGRRNEELGGAGRDDVDGNYKRGTEGKMLKMQSVHVDGFGAEQVWGQARLVLDAVCEEIEEGVEKLIREGRMDGEDDGVSGRSISEEEDEEDDSELGESDGMSSEGMYEDYGMDQAEDVKEVDKEEEDEEETGKQLGRKQKRNITFADDIQREDEDMPDVPDGEEIDETIFDDTGGVNLTASRSYVTDPNGLNDGFFSIDDFNRQSEFMESIDARGDPDDGAASDEEEVDWTVDPLTVDIDLDEEDGDDVEKEDDDDQITRRKLVEKLAEDEDEDLSTVEENMSDMDIIGNANNIMYKDFFEPPPERASKRRQKKPNKAPHAIKEANGNQNDIEQDDGMERAMSVVQQGLFDEDSLASDVDGSEEEDKSAVENLSSHQKQQAKLIDEIRRLEAENVAKREWTLSGEAKAVERPLNSLLEENLDFERIGKPAPVITAEVSEDIEAIIKQRIINREFDEVRRRRPDELIMNPAPRRGRMELDETKSKRGLAEEYEEEHLRRTDPNFVDVKDEKLRAKHREIERQWREVSAKLDALASWHYRPKPAEANFEIRVDAPAITMEDAQPTAGSEVAGASRLAPQEIYAPGQEKENGEVVTKGGTVMRKEEMSREQKKRRRRREKERIRKTGGGNAPAKNEGRVNGKAEERKKILTDLKKGDVKVIGKKGELNTLDDKRVSGQRAITVGSLKL